MFSKLIDRSYPLFIAAAAILLAAALMCSAGCSVPSWPTLQHKTIVFGLEVETMGSLASGETPLPKVRAGLIFHEGQIVQRGTAASLYSDYTGVNLLTASGTMRGEMSVTPGITPVKEASVE